MNPIGFSTGALALGDFRSALECLIGKAFTAIELSALRESELPILLNAIPSLELSQFSYIALHAPSSFEPSREPEIIALLAKTPEHWKIVLHPDTISNVGAWSEFGTRLVLENMDRRKLDGRSAEEMSRWFTLLPEARFCLDLAHVQKWDTTMTEAYLLLKQFKSRISQVHVSQLDSASRHHRLSEGAVRAFSDIAWLIPENVPFIIESRVSSDQMDDEIANVKRIVSSMPTGLYSQIPA